MPADVIPDDPGASADNAAVRSAIAAFQEAPDYDRLATLLRSVRQGQLVVDVTGTRRSDSVRARTIRSTRGELILPLFTSFDELRRAVPKSRSRELRGAALPAREAVGLIRSERFVAAQFDAGSSALVVRRPYLELAASDEDIDAQHVQGLG